MKLPTLSLLAPQSLRWRLTLWHGLALSVVLIAFTLAVYWMLSTQLSEEIDRSLNERAQQVNESFQREAVLPLLQGRREIPIPRPNSFASADTFVQVATLEGHIKGRSENLGDMALPLDADLLAEVQAGRDQYGVAQLDGEQVRLYTSPLILLGRPVGVLQVARSMQPVESALAQLRVLAGVGLLAALGLAAIIVWLATRAALRPLEQLIGTAEAIGSSRDLGRRVPQPPSQDEVGRLAGTFNAMLDRLEASHAQLRAAYAKVESALEAQRRFVADASHELRTPLTTIRGNASLLRQYADVTPEDRVAALSQIAQEAERMSRLVHDLLTLARADAGQPLAHVPVSLGPLVQEALSKARLLANGQQIELEGVVPVEVMGDPDALQQLALILLDNAIKYTPPGGQVRVTLEREGGEARLVVSDTGVGIRPEDLPHVFERFYRADRGRKAGGTGLGLSIAQWIVGQHGGKIEVESAPGRGSTFTVRLPLPPVVVRSVRASSQPEPKVPAAP